MSKKTLNKTNLEALGAEQLAALLIEVSTGSADIKRRLRLELSYNLGARELAHDMRKRFASLRKSNSFIGWRKRKAMVKDLAIQAALITDKIAPDDPTIAFDLLWEFIEIAPSIYARVDDKNGDIGDVFRAAILKFEDIAPRAQLDPVDLADRVWVALLDNGHGEWDGIITLAAPALDAIGLAHLKATIEAYGDTPVETATDDHEAIRFLRQLRGGDDYVAKRKARFVKLHLQEIAAIAGDTQAYIAQYSDNDLRRKDITAKVANLLLADGEPGAALDVLLGAVQDDDPQGQDAWNTTYIASLLALGRADDAQAHRLDCFHTTLSTHHLRDYLKGLPDFEDVEAEESAKTHVLAFPDVETALGFCLEWPDLLTAAQLIDARADDINGGNSHLLTATAEALRLRYPRAATLVLRAMIDWTLIHTQSARYGQAAEHLADCAALDAEIAEYGTWPDHPQYLKTLQTRHEYAFSFWAKVAPKSS